MFKAGASAQSLYLAACCVAAILASQVVAGTVEFTQEPTSPDAAISVSGVVTTPAGEPIEGATVVLRAKIGGQYYFSGVRHNRDILARTETNAQGEFQFQSIGLPPRMAKQIDSLRQGAGGAELVAWSPGNAIYFSDLKNLVTKEQLLVKLAREAKVSGEVRNEQGKPVGGATLRLYGITGISGELDGTLREPGDLNLNLSELNFSSESDSSGRFVFHHLPPGRFVLVNCKAADREGKTIVIDASGSSDLEQVRFQYGVREPRPLMRSPITVVLAPAKEKEVVVKVIDPEGKQVVDGAIQVITDKRHFAGWVSMDARGEARFPLKESGKYEFQYASDPLRPRLGTRLVVDVDLNGELQPIELRLQESCPLTGQVIDAETKKPVAGAYIYYLSGKEGDDTTSRSFCLAVSRRDGKFQMPVLPGPGELAFHKEVEGYFPPVILHQIDPRKFETAKYPIDVSATDAPELVTLTLARGLVIRGIVRDSKGAPVQGAQVRGHSRGSPYISRSTTTDAEGRFELAGLSPHVNSVLAAAADSGATQKDLEAMPTHPWEQTRFEEVELTLEAGVKVTGRVVDANGKPIPAIRMRLYKAIPTGADSTRIHWLCEVDTDSEGRYAVVGLAPGDGYQFEIVAPEGMIAPDWRHQSPFMPKLPPDVRSEHRLPDAVLVTRGQSLRGVVVDPSGMPVPAVRVSANLVGSLQSGRPRRGPPPWTKTDEQGRFELHELPDKPMELMIYKPNPQGGFIRNMARAQPEMNQKDIRITYDPGLDQEFEDLN